MTMYVKLQGSRIIAALETDGASPGAEWADAGAWVGFTERPALGWAPFLEDGAVTWQDMRSDPGDIAAQLSVVRRKRDQLLQGCDWVTTRALELAQPVPEEWLTYRQALRDITLQNPFSPSWPTPPI